VAKKNFTIPLISTRYCNVTLDLLSPMPSLKSTVEYMQLTVSERIQLVEDIWDSIAAEAPDTIGLSPTQKAELHRRAAAHRADPSTAVPWEQVRSDLFSIKP
jgi:putative addiction module component (TIGR02574 family)